MHPQPTSRPGLPHLPTKPGYPEILGITLLAFLFYRYIFGSFTLNPQTVAWLLAGDPAQHYLGWAFFRHDAWHWPPGLMTNYGLPLGSSIARTDSIPLLALLFKPFSAWLPEPFQYFGPWMLACFILNGYFGLRLMALVTPHASLRALCALFFVFSPVLLFRAHGHESLMAHWLLLAALGSYLSGWRPAQWATWSILAALIHPYLLLMILGLMTAAVLQALWTPGCARRPLMRAVGAILAAVLCSLWLAGYLGAGVGANEGYGYFSMNALALFNPIPVYEPAFLSSRFLLPHLHHPDFLPYGQYEGYLYLGAGMLVLLIVAGTLILADRPWSAAGVVAWLRPLTRRYGPLLGVALLFWLLALSNKVMLGRWHMFTVPLPDLVLQGLAIFRASGRFGWPLYYLLMLAVLALIARHLPRNIALVVLGSALLLQFADQRIEHKGFRALYQQRLAWASPLQNPAWDRLAAQAQRLILLPPHPPMEQVYIPFALLAAKHRLATNAAHLARADPHAENSAATSEQAGLQHGQPEPATLYVYFQEPAGLPATLREQLKSMDAYYVLPPRAAEAKSASTKNSASE